MVGADPIAAFAQRAPTLSDEALPTALLLNVGELRFGQRPLHAVRASATREGALWQARVDAQELAGALRYHSDGAGRLHARLTRLYLPAESRQQEAPPLLEQPAQSLPGVDLSADDFRLAGKALGRLDIVADNQGPDSTDASASVWRLQRLELALPEGALHAQGEWRLPPARPGARGRTSLAVRLDVRDAGALLARLDMPGVLRGGRGQLAGHLGWRGSPIAPNAATMHGALNVGVEQGQFLKADAGAAKLLGVLSLQALPRRLTLNFKDVFSEGFAFDYIRGDVQMDRGLARTNNLQMKGINAAVLMSGQASVVDETQDLRVVVVPEIDAGTAALVATAINPAIGIGAFIAQWLLRRPLSSAATQEFHISGQWSDPKVSRIDSKTHAAGGSAAPPTSAPPAAPAASAAAAAPADEADDRDADDRDLAPASAPARAPARAASAPASAPAGH